MCGILAVAAEQNNELGRLLSCPVLVYLTGCLGVTDDSYILYCSAFHGASIW